MTRGRKKDTTIPPSRSLTQQRDYRARKQQYVTELEDRCTQAEAECARLNVELAALRAHVGCPPPSQETVMASAELFEHLNATAASLARFQQIALLTHNPASPSSSRGNTQPSFYPSPNSILSTPRPLNPEVGPCSPPQIQMSTPAHLSYESGSECCGGFVDCSRCTDDEERPASPVPFIRALESDVRSDREMNTTGACGSSQRAS